MCDMFSHFCYFVLSEALCSPMKTTIFVFPNSPYVVKYYGSYFKNTDLWIVMEYCGAGSVSDIIRLRNKTVGT